MSAARTWLAVEALATGAFLGVSQWGAYLFLSSYMASTATVYLATTLAWLTGSVAGTCLPFGGARAWLAAATLAHGALCLQASLHPHELGWLPVLLALVAAIGAYPGAYFRLRAPRFAHIHWLFFLESGGFLAGTLAAFALCAAGGLALVAAAPLPLALVAALCGGPAAPDVDASARSGAPSPPIPSA